MIPKTSETKKSLVAGARDGRASIRTQRHGAGAVRGALTAGRKQAKTAQFVRSAGATASRTAVVAGRAAAAAGNTARAVAAAAASVIGSTPILAAATVVIVAAMVALVAVAWLLPAAQQAQGTGEDSGSFAMADDYPYKGMYSEDDMSPLGYAYGNCTDFVAWRINRDAGGGAAPWKLTWKDLTPQGGNGADWGNIGNLPGWTYTRRPVPGDVISIRRAGVLGSSTSAVGHVGYVGAVDGSGTVTIENYGHGRYFLTAAFLAQLDDPETGLAQLTETIIANTTGEKDNGGDGFWERAERALLTALTAYVWATTAHTGSTEPNLPGVLDLQKGMQGSEENKDEMTSETDLRFAAAREIVAEWHSNPNPDDDPAVMKVLDFACRQYRIYEQGPAETRMSVVISLGVRLALLDMHDVRTILTTDDLAIDRIGYERTALFLQIPDTHHIFKFISAMFWQTLFSLTVYQADHEKTGHLPELLHMFLDEFANIGKIPAFEQVMATIRSRGISASIIMQSRSQGKTLFGDAWAGVENNCDTKLFLGGDEEQTTKWVSQLLGYQTIVTSEYSESRGSHGSWSKSMRVTKRELMMPDEIGRLPDDEAILKIRGMNPFRSKKLAV
ncbi:conjugal plasmid transfer, ATPase [Leifsonia xyli subsp. xyli str. CTCB07]|uniref:Conjugal plasmid transfer, ATPase n=1 Tax=Leifsonia xyli subsp. xyli (strain CTCB07) TaxID=281090 RepID=Q6AG10_LEIXX|nr:conjugal plasmid transfer, ATPase [Leifsonia xyli subsp. xyli str. CTCB07]